MFYVYLLSQAQLCSRLRKAKFIAVPLDNLRHALVAPWRISLVLKEHRPPMFALPDYLKPHARASKTSLYHADMSITSRLKEMFLFN